MLAILQFAMSSLLNFLGTIVIMLTVGFSACVALEGLRGIVQIDNSKAFYAAGKGDSDGGNNQGNGDTKEL